MQTYADNVLIIEQIPQNTNNHNNNNNFQDNCAGQSQNPARPLDRAKRTGTLLMREKGRLAR